MKTVVSPSRPTIFLLVAGTTSAVVFVQWVRDLPLFVLIATPLVMIGVVAWYNLMRNRVRVVEITADTVEITEGGLWQETRVSSYPREQVSLRAGKIEGSYGFQMSVTHILVDGTEQHYLNDSNFGWTPGRIQQIELALTRTQNSSDKAE